MKYYKNTTSVKRTWLVVTPMSSIAWTYSSISSSPARPPELAATQTFEREHAKQVHRQMEIEGKHTHKHTQTYCASDGTETDHWRIRNRCFWHFVFKIEQHVLEMLHPLATFWQFRPTLKYTDTSRSFQRTVRLVWACVLATFITCFVNSAVILEND